MPGGIRVKLAFWLLLIVGGALCAAYMHRRPVARAPARRREARTAGATQALASLCVFLRINATGRASSTVRRT